MLAFMSVTGYVGMKNLQGLSLELIAPDEVYAGLAAPFVLRVTNRKSRLPSFLLEFRYYEAVGLIPWLARQGEATTSLPLVFDQRGHGHVEALLVRSPFPVNFFIRSWRLPVAGTFVIFPHPLPGDAAGDGEEGQQRESGGWRQRGVGGEIERIVDYSGREPLKQIHWKLSARSEQFKVKEYGDQAPQPLLIDPAVLPGGLEERLSRAAGLVRQWGMQRPVGLLLDDQRIEPQQGRRQMLRLLAALALYGRETTSGGAT